MPHSAILILSERNEVAAWREENGLVQIYYGDGKGKTTAAFGLAFRCAGWGRRVVIAQFLKSSPCGS